jgi:antitoxin (DNA-binding transcriptional repressor) of toxin-antitoxin stability system
MKTVNIHYAKTNLSKLIEDVLTNQRVIICRNNEPIVELKRIKAQDLRKPGMWRGRVKIFDKKQVV